MSDLQFSHCNIAMSTHETTGRTIVWDRDADVFGSGYDYPEALADLASNYSDDYRDAPLQDDEFTVEDVGVDEGHRTRDVQ